MPTIVLVCFQKGGGKNGQHGWTLSTPNISSLSNISVQLFKYTHLHVFCAVHNADAHLQTQHFELIKVCQLLTILWNMPHLSLPMGADVKISEEDCVIYQLLKEKIQLINLALKYINCRKAEESADVDSEVVDQK
jgi:hypothetical protein